MGSANTYYHRCPNARGNFEIALWATKSCIYRLLSMIPRLSRTFFSSLWSNLELRSWHRTELNELPLVIDFYKCPQAEFAWFCGWTNFGETLGVARVAWLLEQSPHIDVAWVQVLASTPYADGIVMGFLLCSERFPRVFRFSETVQNTRDTMWWTGIQYPWLLYETGT